MMKRFFYISSFLFLTTQLCFGQGFNLLDAQAINPGFVTDATYDDVNGFIYVTGQYDPFDTSVDFDPGAGTSAVPQYGGFSDIFIAKYDLNYNLMWVRGIGGDGNEYPNKIKVDNFGNVFVVGNFDGSVMDIDPSVGTVILSNAGGSGDLGGFAVELDANGSFQSGYEVNFLGPDDISGIDFDGSNNIFIVGTTGASVFFEKLPDFFSSSTFTRILASAGNQFGKDIFVKGSTFIINGIFDSDIELSTVPSVIASPAGSFDIFFAEYDATLGTYTSHGVIGGLGDDEITKSVLDPVSSSLIITGFFDNTADFDPSGSTMNLSPVGGYDFFVAEYGSAGNLSWAKSIGGSNDDFSTGLDVNTAGQVYVTGSFQGTVNFDPTGSGFILQSADAEDSFLVTYSIGGGFTNAMRLGDVGYDEGEAVLQAGLDIYLFAGFGSLNVDVDLNCSEFFLSDGYGLLTYEYVGMLDTEPANQPTNLSFNSITSNSFNGAFDAAASAPDGYLVLMSAKQLPDIDPIDGRDYCDNEIIGTNGSGEFIYAIFNDFQSFGIGMISPPEELFFKIYSFNGSGPSTNYLLTNPLTGSQAPNIGPEPTIQASNFMFQSGANTFQDLSWNRGNGTSGLIIVAKAGSSVDRVPTDGVSYNANDIFGLGDDLGGGNYVVYNGTGTTLTMNGLSPGTEYHLLGFEYNTTSGIENYLTSIQIPTFFTTTNLCGGDATGPDVFTLNNSLTIDQGADINVSVNVSDSDGCPITEVNIVYVELENIDDPNDPTYIVTPMTSAAAGTYTYTITGATSGVGVMFNIEATNQAGILGYSNDFGVSVNIPSGGYTIPYNSFGDQQTNYRIVSLPLRNLANGAIEAIFDEVGTYDRTKWRMYQYNGTSTSELTGSSTMAQGRGYWLIIRDNPGAITVGGGQTGGATLFDPFVINLNAGWNLIGNPYNFDISWSDILSFNSNPAEITSFKIYQAPGAYADGGELSRFSGGFVLSSAPFQLEIPTYRNPAIQGRRSSSKNSLRNKNSIDQPDWELLLKTKSGDLINTFGGVGMNPEAQVEFDRYDELTLPRFLDYVEIVHDKPQKFNSNYTKDIVPTTENFTWDFVVESNLKDPLIELTWDNSYFGNNDKQLYLWDMALSKAINMRTQTSYIFSKDISHDLKVIYGNQDYVKEKISVSELVFHNVSPNPVSNRALISFSVPEDVDQQAIEISALDLMGRKIWVNSNQFQSGYHEVNWDIDNKATKGIYIVQIQSGNVLKHKRIVIK